MIGGDGPEVPAGGNFIQDAETSSAAAATRRALLRRTAPPAAGVDSLAAADDLDRMISDLERRAEARGSRLNRDERRLVARLRSRQREHLEALLNAAPIEIPEEGSS